MKPLSKPTKIPTGSLSCIRCEWSSGGWPATPLFPPQQKKALHEAILYEILQERVVSSRNRINFRGVKRKMSNYNLRPRKRQPTRRIDISKRIRIVK
jgi:hypothetical protein